MKKKQIKVDALSRFMIYILGHSPDEFGLIPDKKGFVTYKELFRAIHEETGWGYIRQGHINEVLLGKDRSLFQMENNRIRAMERRWHFDIESPIQSLPKILFTAVRRKAHPHVIEKGLISIEGKYLVLSPAREMAIRIGRRRDQEPVLLNIMASAAQKKGISFHAFGSLILANEIPAKFISGPPVSREIIKIPKDATEKKDKSVSEIQTGTFVLDMDRDPDPARRAGGKKQKGWKEKARKIRRGKRQ